MSKGNNDVFLGKISTSDGSFQWVTSAGSSSNDAATGIAVDNLNNAYITGSFISSITIGTTILFPAQTDMYVAKYSDSGSLLRVSQIGAAEEQQVYALAVDSNYNAYLFGYTNAATTMGNFALTFSGGDVEGIVVRLDASGNVVFASSIGNENIGRGATFFNGTLHVIGAFKGTTNFPATATSAGGNDIVYTKIDYICNKCPVGTFSAFYGYTNSCTACPANTYGDTVGATACKYCPGDQTSIAGMIDMS